MAVLKDLCKHGPRCCYILRLCLAHKDAEAAVHVRLAFFLCNESLHRIHHLHGMLDGLLALELNRFPASSYSDRSKGRLEECIETKLEMARDERHLQGEKLKLGPPRWRTFDRRGAIGMLCRLLTELEGNPKHSDRNAPCRACASLSSPQLFLWREKTDAKLTLCGVKTKRS